MSFPDCQLSNGAALTKISAVILDLDGTLLDTESVTEGVLKEFLVRYGREVNLERESKKRVGMTLQFSAASIVKDYDLPLTADQLIDEIMPLYRSRWSQAQALPGADRLIKHLKENRIPFALASNSLREYIDAKISHQHGWKECFSVILGSDQVKSGKPSPDIFIEAARQMGVYPEECLVIEDSLVGVTAAKAANMKVVAIPPRGETDTSLMADSVLHSLLEFQPRSWGLPRLDGHVTEVVVVDKATSNRGQDESMVKLEGDRVRIHAAYQIRGALEHDKERNLIEKL